MQPRRYIALLAVGCILLAGCGGTGTTEPSPTASPTAAETPTATIDAQVASTPEPTTTAPSTTSTPTPAPTPTPTPEPTTTATPTPTPTATPTPTPSTADRVTIEETRFWRDPEKDEGTQDAYTLTATIANANEHAVDVTLAASVEYTDGDGQRTDHVFAEQTVTIGAENDTDAVWTIRVEGTMDDTDESVDIVSVEE